jgi:CBS domain-containing protein
MPDLHSTRLPQEPSDPRWVTDVFHRINSVIPNDPEVFSIGPDTTVRDAITFLANRHCSQVPVVLNGEVLGLFSYRDFAKAVKSHVDSDPRATVGDLLSMSVEECMNTRPEYARVTDEFPRWLDVLEQHEAFLVGDTNRLEATITPMHLVRYLYKVSQPYVLIQEIELGIRSLIVMAVDDDALAETARACLNEKYQPDKLPTTLEDMTFDDYARIVGDGRTWALFQPLFRGDRRRTSTKLRELAELRNKVFHFRGVSVEDHPKLVEGRDWVLTKIRAADARRREASQ